MQIDVDFDVFKTLTMMRRDERDSINDVLRRLAGVNKPDLIDPVPPPSSPGPSGPGCVFKGVHFPEGTQFRTTYKGKVYFGVVKEGEWRDEVGNAYNSPSQAAHALTKHGVNGWTFWECKRPADDDWVRLNGLRKDYPPLDEAVGGTSTTQ